MNEKRSLFEDEVPKHKKKAVSKGLPRSKHKHTYETVLLTKDYHSKDFKTGRLVVKPYTGTYKVCTICGRIDCFDDDPKYYVKKPISDLPFKCYEKELSEEALKLSKWHTNDFWDKFAVKID